MDELRTQLVIDLDGDPGRDEVAVRLRESASPSRGPCHETRFGHALVTSGTTGKPALVRLPGGAWREPLSWYADTLGLSRADVFCFLSGPAHDPMLRQAVLPYLLTARLTIPVPEEQADPGALLEMLAREGVTVLDITPGQAELLAGAAGGATTLPGLRHVTLYGARLTDALAVRLHELAPGAVIRNLYGSTETPQASGLRRWDSREALDPGWRRRRASVPVGKGTPYRELTVLTPAGGVTGIGQLGQVAVRGDGLALGLTDDSGYLRTGDLGRFTPDAEVEIVGRVDRQLSVRGHRVEPAAIESVLRASPDVESVAVGLDAMSALVAWVAVGDRAAGPEQWWPRIRAQLPAWSHPDRTHVLSALPLTANGKPDMAALARLPVPAARLRDADEGDPDLLGRLGACCERVCGHRVEPNRTFFEAGLTSLDLVRVHAALLAEIPYEFSVIDMFRHPSMAQLSQWLRDRAEDPRDQPAPVTRGQHAAAPRTVNPTSELHLRRAARARFAAVSGKDRYAR